MKSVTRFFKLLLVAYDEVNWHGEMPLTATDCIYLTLCGYFTHECGKTLSLGETTHAHTIPVAVPLDAVPERCTKRYPPRFRPGDRFGELSFRYLLPGSEGEKCRSLDSTYVTEPFHPLNAIVNYSNM